MVWGDSDASQFSNGHSTSLLGSVDKYCSIWLAKHSVQMSPVQLSWTGRASWPGQMEHGGLSNTDGTFAAAGSVVAVPAVVVVS